jgi:hypothetical protein
LENNLEARKLKAKIILDYDDCKTAQTIADSISPDNYPLPTGLTVSTRQTEGRVETEIDFSGRIATLIATIDDLLESAATAEKALHVVNRTSYAGFSIEESLP